MPPFALPLVARVLAAALAAVPLAALAGPRLIVQFNDTDVEAAFSPKSRVDRLGRELGTEARHLRRMSLGAHVVELAPGADAQAAALAAVANGYAKQAMPDKRRKPKRTVNDPNAGWYLSNNPSSINAQAAWDLTTGASGIIVAIVDTGILPHPDLAGRILPGYDFIYDVAVANDGDGRDADPTDAGDWVTAEEAATPDFQDCEVANSSWHGTAVAGLVGANADNGQYAAGVDWNARILPVRALGKCGGSDSDILDGIAWAAGLPVPGVPPNPNVAHVINLSLGGLDDAPCPAFYDVLLNQVLSTTGTRAIVAAAGNLSDNADLNVPSSCPATIAVAATTNLGNRTSYTNTGASVDIAAPGGSGASAGTLIQFLDNGGTTVPNTAWGIGADRGTSFATPLVAGAIGLMLSVAPNLTPAQVRQILESTAKPFSATSTCDTTMCGHGILNAQAAVAAAEALASASQNPPVVEYFNAGFGHYFMTAQSDEISGLDGGAYGGAFVRTGRKFNAWSTQTAGTVPVCRFFTTPGTFGTKSSHFYTANPVECDGLKLNPNWIYEKIAFYVAVPTNGVCPGGTIPVYRMYNHGQTGAPNHRFTTDLATYQLFTTTMGWDQEGIGFCSLP
jgi:serine protease